MKINFVNSILITICAISLSSCVELPSKEAYNHAPSLTVLDEYTLKSDKHLIKDFPPVDDSGNINVVVEIPTGTREKWEVDKVSGNLIWEFENEKPRIVSYLGYPGNYGMIPQTLLPKEFGGDGDPLDVLVLGSALPRGAVVTTRVIGILNLLDNGEQDDKLIAVPLNSDFGQVFSIQDLRDQFGGATDIIEIWFANYKGIGQVETRGFSDVADAKRVIEVASTAYDLDLEAQD